MSDLSNSLISEDLYRLEQERDLAIEALREMKDSQMLGNLACALSGAIMGFVFGYLARAWM